MVDDGMGLAGQTEDEGQTRFSSLVRSGGCFLGEMIISRDLVPSGVRPGRSVREENTKR